jgi:two-component system OmpR family response regulator
MVGEPGSLAGCESSLPTHDMVVTVLLVDDADDARAALANRLRRLTALQLLASVRDASEAAAALRRSRPDVLLVDLHSHHWPEDGLALCARLRELTTVPLVVITSFMTDERWKQLQAAGVDNWLLKRIDGERLEQQIVGLGVRRGPPAGEGEEQSR